MNPWLGILAFVLGLGVLFALLRALERRKHLHPELVRKLAHVSMGLATLIFPWLFAEPWPVLTLAGIAIAGLLALRFVSAVQRELGAVLHGVSRRSYGELYFPLAVAVLFVLAEGDAILFCVPMLMLTLADALAALIGVRYGSLHYSTAEGSKTLEGSVAFFIVAFASVHIPLLLLTPLGNAETLLIALILGLLVMLFEAIAWRGLDNLFIPLAAFILLQRYMGLDALALSLRLLTLIALLVAFIVWRRRTTLNDSAVLGAVLVGYITGTAGGWVWLIAPVLVLLAYSWRAARAGQSGTQAHSIHAVVYIALPGLIWLFFSQAGTTPALLYPYTLAYAGQLAMIGVARTRYAQPELAEWMVWQRSVLESWLVLFVPFVIVAGISMDTLVLALSAVAMIGFVALAFLRWQPHLDNCPTDLPRWWRQAVLALSGSLLGIPLLTWVGAL